LEAHSASVNVGHSDLSGKVRVLFSGFLYFYDVAPAMLRRCLFGGVEKKKRTSRTLPRELEELDAVT